MTGHWSSVSASSSVCRYVRTSLLCSVETTRALRFILPCIDSNMPAYPTVCSDWKRQCKRSCCVQRLRINVPVSEKLCEINFTATTSVNNKRRRKKQLQRAACDNDDWLGYARPDNSSVRGSSNATSCMPFCARMCCMCVCVCSNTKRRRTLVAGAPHSSERSRSGAWSIDITLSRTIWVWPSRQVDDRSS